MDSSMFIGTWWSIIPPVLAIVLAFITKEVYSSLLAGVIIGVCFYTGFQPWAAIEAMFTIMKDNLNLNILIFDVLLGMIIVLMQKSGGSAAYGRWASTKIKSKKSALLATSGLGVLIFVDDYFNCLTVGSVMRPVTDRFKVSRAKLAYIIDATAAPVCIIAPISSWAAAVDSYVTTDLGISGFQIFLRSIPFNLYALLTLFMVVYITVRGIDFGLMKIHEKNAANGDLFTSGAGEYDNVAEEKVSEDGRVSDLILPIVVLIVSAVACMIYTGTLNGGTGLIGAFANCDSSYSLVVATFITIIFMMLLYLPRKIVTFNEFMNSLIEGFKMMIPAIMVLILAWTLQGVTGALEISSFVTSIVDINASTTFIIPLIMFGVAVFLSFSTGTSWGTFAILIPIICGLFGGQHMDMMIISISAVLAGSVMGDHVSPISDTTIMSSSGAQSNHMNHVSTQMQYAMVVTAACAVGYIVAGLTQSWIISLAVGLVVVIAILEVLCRREAKAEA